MVAAPAASAATLIGATAVGSGAGKLGASGLGASTVNGGVALGAIGTAFGGQLHIILPALIGGMIGSYLGGLCLLRFAENADERRQIRGFVFMNTATAAIFGVGVLFVVALTSHWVPILLYALAGMAVINYQCLVPLQRIMGPMLARDAARRGRPVSHWLYESMYGRTGVFIANVLVALALGWAFLK